jgi:hypothetical protein
MHHVVDTMPSAIHVVDISCNRFQADIIGWTSIISSSSSSIVVLYDLFDILIFNLCSSFCVRKLSFVFGKCITEEGHCVHTFGVENKSII